MDQVALRLHLRASDAIRPFLPRLKRIAMFACCGFGLLLLAFSYVHIAVTANDCLSDLIATAVSTDESVEILKLQFGWESPEVTTPKYSFGLESDLNELKTISQPTVFISAQRGLHDMSLKFRAAHNVSEVAVEIDVSTNECIPFGLRRVFWSWPELLESSVLHSCERVFDIQVFLLGSHSGAIYQTSQSWTGVFFLDKILSLAASLFGVQVFSACISGFLRVQMMFSIDLKRTYLALRSNNLQDVQHWIFQLSRHISQFILFWFLLTFLERIFLPGADTFTQEMYVVLFATFEIFGSNFVRTRSAMCAFLPLLLILLIPSAYVLMWPHALGGCVVALTLMFAALGCGVVFLWYEVSAANGLTAEHPREVPPLNEVIVPRMVRLLVRVLPFNAQGVQQPPMDVRYQALLGAGPELPSLNIRVNASSGHAPPTATAQAGVGAAPLPVPPQPQPVPAPPAEQSRRRPPHIREQLLSALDDSRSSNRPQAPISLNPALQAAMRLHFQGQGQQGQR